MSFFEKLKLKIEGARKSLTVGVIAVWQLVIQNIDSIQSMFPQFNEYFGDNLGKIVSGVFGAILLYVRLFNTKGKVEDKVDLK